MVDFKIDFGPWEPIFAGKAYGHEVEIVTNQEHIYLVFIYELLGEKKVGALVEGYKALVARGQIESFINTLPKASMGVIKNDTEKSQKVFFLTFETIYLDFNQEDYLKKLDYSIQKNIESIRTIVDLGRTSSIELKELGEASIKDYFQIVGDPFVMKVLLSPKRTSGLTRMSFKETEVEEKQTKIQLGLTKNREIAIEKTRNLYRTSITGENESETQYCAYIIAENLLLEGKQVILFDSQHYFEGLASASKNDFKLKEQLVEYEPSGFPVKKIIAKENMKVSLKDTELHLLLDTIGCGDNDLETGLLDLFEKTNFNTPIELIGELLNAEKLNDFQKLKAERILRIIDKKYANIFGKNIDFQELVKKWPGSLGRATIIDTSKLDKKENLLFTQAAMNYLQKSVKNESVPEIALILNKTEELLKVKKIIQIINELETSGFGAIFVGKNTVPEELEDSIVTKINIIKGNDIAINVKGKPSYRIYLRPSLSGEVKY